MAIMDRDSISIGRSISLTNVFYFVLGGAKSCLYPFITLFFRQLGLTATEVGMILACKGFIALIVTPMWTACAKGCNIKRLVLVYSLFCLITVNLFLTLVPPINYNLPMKFCGLNETELEWMELQIAANQSGYANETTSLKGTTLSQSFNSSRTAATIFSKLSVTTPPSALPELNLTAADVALLHHYGLNDTALKTITTVELNKIIHNLLKPNKLKAAVMKGQSAITIKPKNMASLKSNNTRDKRSVQKLTTDTIKSELSSQHKENIRPDAAVLTSWNGFHANIYHYRMHIFTVLMVLVSTGELLSAPVDKLADDYWFEYLDITNKLEIYGGHHCWMAFASILFPLMISTLIQHTPCYILPFINHLNLHFYSFSALTGIAFVLAICFPMIIDQRTMHHTRLGKGLQLAFGDVHAGFLSVTLLYVGASSTLIFNFLLWRLQDLMFTSYSLLGGIVCIAAASHFLILLIHKVLVRNVGTGFCVLFGLLLLIGRLVLYSFAKNKLLFFVGESLSGLSQLLISLAISRYGDFMLNEHVTNRSARMVHKGITMIGCCIGCLAGGWLLDSIGFEWLFRGAAILLCMWTLMMMVIYCCVRKSNKVKYAKLLEGNDNDDDDGYSDESNTMYEDDWLDSALKKDNRKYT